MPVRRLSSRSTRLRCWAPALRWSQRMARTSCSPMLPSCGSWTTFLATLLSQWLPWCRPLAVALLLRLRTAAARQSRPRRRRHRSKAGTAGTRAKGRASPGCREERQRAILGGCIGPRASSAVREGAWCAAPSSCKAWPPKWHRSPPRELSWYAPSRRLRPGRTQACGSSALRPLATPRLSKAVLPRRSSSKWRGLRERQRRRLTASSPP
mmetsp:Transcript_97972/g.263268  ORF Transcript_97972/g.263268 Transcript_97972/m.263268 type:complete len:210 (-) Transcript_97972:720-1349(-)